VLEGAAFVNAQISGSRLENAWARAVSFRDANLAGISTSSNLASWWHLGLNDFRHAQVRIIESVFQKSINTLDDQRKGECRTRVENNKNLILFPDGRADESTVIPQTEPILTESAEKEIASLIPKENKAKDEIEYLNLFIIYAERVLNEKPVILNGIARFVALDNPPRISSRSDKKLACRMLKMKKSWNLQSNEKTSLEIMGRVKCDTLYDE